MSKRWLGRRQFLFGAGGAAFALPPLISLMAKDAAAQMTPARRLVLFPMEFGMHTRYLRPTDEALAPHLRPVSTDIRAAALEDIDGPMSHVLDASYDGLRPYMNVFRGLDATYTNSHTHGGFCGSGANIDADNTNRKPTYGKSIDVVVEQSAAFRAEFTGRHPTLRPQHRGPKPKSWDREPGAVFPTAMPRINGDAQLARAVFQGVDPGDMEQMQRALARAARRQRIVDEVREDLRDLERHPRLSASDRRMVERAVSSVNDVERRLEADVSRVGMRCDEPILDFVANDDGELEGQSAGQLFDNFADILTVAFLCDTSRIAFINNSLGKDDGSGIGHHELDEVENQGTDRQKWAIGRMLRKLAENFRDTPDPLGEGTLLDNSLIIMMNEHSGRRSHSRFDLPVLTFGGLGGTINTGQYIDFRQQADERYGHPAKMLLQTAMLGMGVTQDEYRAIGDGNGFGEWNNAVATGSLAAFNSTHNEPLPFFTR